ncbi:MAG: hypothetical protein ACI8PB_001413 [Desulforhopalus sp.]|jgi:hypothetical protein
MLGQVPSEINFCHKNTENNSLNTNLIQLTGMIIFVPELVDAGSYTQCCQVFLRNPVQGVARPLGKDID